MFGAFKSCSLGFTPTIARIFLRRRSLVALSVKSVAIPTQTMLTREIPENYQPLYCQIARYLQNRVNLMIPVNTHLKRKGEQ